MARQSTTPVSFNKSIRKDASVLMTSGRAGVVVPIGYAPLLAGDAASGRVGIDVALKEMPKPLLNAVYANVQAWFVPKSAQPYFSGRDELIAAMTGDKIKSLTGGTLNERTPPKFFQFVATTALSTFASSAFARTLGLHVPPSGAINTDLIDAYNLVQNFRRAAHSSKIARRPYFLENNAEACTLGRAFWPSARFSRVVPDYERALVVGNLDLDVAAGRIPVHGIGVVQGTLPAPATNISVYETGTGATTFPHARTAGGELRFEMAAAGSLPSIYAEMSAQSISVTLADIDKARTTQAFAKLRAAYAGNDTTGFTNDDAIVALLMQGIPVPEDQFNRPWLLDSKRVPIGFAERFATDAANLEQSVTVGRASASLSLNVPMTDTGGVIIFTVEVLPERIDERMSDEWLQATEYQHLPNALRDIQRVEPVDLVPNRRIDAKHANPPGLYGYEPMNDKWNRDFTRLGGDFYQATPGAGWTENRSNIWQTELVNPSFNDSHYLAPTPFPHSVFADANAHAFEVVCRHNLTISGLTQIGDVLAENGDDYNEVANEL